MRKLIVLLLYGLGLAQQSTGRRFRHWFRWSASLDKHHAIWKLAEIPACVGIIVAGAKLHSGHVQTSIAFENDIVRQVETYSRSTPSPTPKPTPQPPRGLQVTQRYGNESSYPPAALNKALDGIE